MKITEAMDLLADNEAVREKFRPVGEVLEINRFVHYGIPVVEALIEVRERLTQTIHHKLAWRRDPFRADVIEGKQSPIVHKDMCIRAAANDSEIEKLRVKTELETLREHARLLVGKAFETYWTDDEVFPQDRTPQRAS